jgi:hypothetical protein
MEELVLLGAEINQQLANSCFDNGRLMVREKYGRLETN